ncbi:hypothetical protein LZ009_22635 [Ramlibacter sp. XY19]|uniref:hypothetical protein n=1 Tax=Ramlibacter paludis TaxID=2908000 RepID=UPI0023DB1825|nr:hypothetical protein [Ramlibacter paludis]MCG2595585.1 hypothetical protein [Ramlibacter paludis]
MILAKTTAGQQALKDRSVALSLRQRAALILVDGKRSVDDIRQATEAAPEDIAQLRELQLVQEAANEPGPQRSAQELYAAAYPIAVRLTGELGLRGFRLNLAVEAAPSFDALVDLAPRILEAVGVEKFRPLHRVLQLAR